MAPLQADEDACPLTVAKAVGDVRRSKQIAVGRPGVDTDEHGLGSLLLNKSLTYISSIAAVYKDSVYLVVLGWGRLIFLGNCPWQAAIGLSLMVKFARGNYEARGNCSVYWCLSLIHI